MTAIDDWIAELQRFRGSANVAPLFANVDTVVAFLQAISGFANGTIFSSGTYVPTLTNGANVAASTPFDHRWMRIGNNVMITGRIFIDPTAGAVTTALNISLPIAQNNFTSLVQAAGTSHRTGALSPRLSADIFAETGAQTVRLNYLNDADLTNQIWINNFMYTIQ